MLDYNPFVSPHLENPHSKLEEAKERCPVFFSSGLQTWVLTRYADIVGALGDTARFSSAYSTTNVTTPLPDPVLQVLSEGLPYEGGIVDMDPPTHTVYRRLFSKAFTPRRLAAIEPRITDILNELMSAFTAKASGELVGELAYPLPMRVIAGLFGVPATAMEDFKRWSEDWLVLLAQRGTIETLVDAARGVTAFQRYIYDLLESRRFDKRDDLASDLVRAVAEMDSPLNTAALVGVLMTILFAGHETTTTLIGNTVRLLLQHPEQLAAVRANAALIPAAIVESLRFDPPVPGMYRTATVDVDMRAVTLPAMSHIQLSFVSANRDAAVFSAPHTFDIFRDNNGSHLSFGRGAHFCIGANLAQAEARAAVGQILALPRLRLAAGCELRSVQSATVRTNEEIWLEWG